MAPQAAGLESMLQFVFGIGAWTQDQRPVVPCWSQQRVSFLVKIRIVAWTQDQRPVVPCWSQQCVSFLVKIRIVGLRSQGWQALLLGRVLVPIHGAISYQSFLKILVGRSLHFLHILLGFLVL